MSDLSQPMARDNASADGSSRLAGLDGEADQKASVYGAGDRYKCSTIAGHLGHME